MIVADEEPWTVLVTSLPDSSPWLLLCHLQPEVGNLPRPLRGARLETPAVESFDAFACIATRAGFPRPGDAADSGGGRHEASWAPPSSTETSSHDVVQVHESYIRLTALKAVHTAGTPPARSSVRLLCPRES